MNEWIQMRKKKLEELFREYGKVIFVGMSLVVVGIIVYIAFLFVVPAKLQVSFLDVGQGDAILIQTPSGKSMLIDGGPNANVLSKISQKLSYFDRDIDVVVETHPDADHVTGLIPVLEKYTVKKIISSPAKSETQVFADLSAHTINEHAETYVAHTGDVIDFHDGVIAQILYPEEKYREKKNDTNDASVSLVLTYGDETFLLTGDLPSVEESKLIQNGLSKGVTVYKAGHHGSKNSSSEILLSYIHPEYSIISAGKNNKYGHPNPEAVERLQKYSKEIISTIDRGTISFVTNGRIMDVKTDK